MREIVDLKVTQVRLYPIDVLPLTLLLVEKNLAPFRESLRFKSASAREAKPERAIIEFLGGEFEHQGKAHLVDRLTIESQRVTLVLYGTSATADAFYEEVRKIVAAADPEVGFPKSGPYVKVDETSCIVTLDVDFRKLFAPALVKFLEKTVRTRTSTDFASSDVLPARFSARVAYELVNPDLRKAGIRLVDKTLTIEPRVTTRPEERRYYTLSPTDSETHLALLREFEKAFKGPKK